MKVVIACDSFKDALPAKEVCRAIEEGIKAEDPQVNVVQIPLADGGEGTAEILTDICSGERILCRVLDPIGRMITAQYGRSENNRIAFIDMAAASGLQLLKIKERNPLVTTSYGTGQLIRDAIEKGAKKIILGIGGSATNDGGMGMARALGYSFEDKKGLDLIGMGKELEEVSRIGMSDFLIKNKVEVEVLCDVDNPLLGHGGAAEIYAGQKGANEMEIKILERGMRVFVEVCKKHLGKEYSKVPGAGAAGGMGFGAMQFLGARLRSGIEVVLDYAKFHAHLREADLVFTGEGKIDSQTIYGKAIKGICSRSIKQGVPVVALTGKLEATQIEIKTIGLTAAFSLSRGPGSLEDAIISTKENLVFTSGQIFSLFVTSKLK